ncbi:hypothetical protein M408DRAFT_29059 [Serendipita vermifera MAFF 305830]|uniref:F-box domain-containing protein n=1 Tax=Serendipita vermifera MAFF 305830 TaxID=933852 RepID=A0A0C2WXH6_SERVB|nr:hypothetical protein M408DRAFT_29059 [Serendipita vermifera MAFF 305830]
MSPVPYSIHLLCATDDKAVGFARNLPFTNQPSLILQFKSSVTKLFIETLLRCFPEASGLKIVRNSHLHGLQPEIHTRRSPPIERLTLDLTSFDSFRIDYYFEATFIQEIHIIHNGSDTPQGRPASWLCPCLEVLGITPPDTLWLENYRMPLLRLLILYGPKLHNIAASSLFPLSEHQDFQNAVEFELRHWPIYKPAGAQEWSIMLIVLAIANNLRSVEIIRCVDSHIDGENFISLISQLKKTGDDQNPSKLKTIDIDCCTGITRMQCDQLATLVDKLVVHV